MKPLVFAAAALGTLSLAACQPSEPAVEATSADTAAEDIAATAPAATPTEGTLASGSDMAAPPAPRPTGGSSATIHSDGTMSNGAANPASPPPVAAPDDMNTPNGG